MHCLPDFDPSLDEPFWVTKKDFVAHFDQVDFANRDCENVIDAYLKDWFVFESASASRFILPTVQFVCGKTQFISGRHRTAVLLKHMAEIPVAFAMGFGSNSDTLSKISKRLLNRDEMLLLPDLDIYEMLP